MRFLTGSNFDRLSLPAAFVVSGCLMALGQVSSDKPIERRNALREESAIEQVGQGITLTATLKPTDLKVGMMGSPAWWVELSVKNQTRTRVELGETFVVVQTYRDTNAFAAAWLVRQGQHGESFGNFAERHGGVGLYGVVVGEKGSTWPAATLSGKSPMGRFETALATDLPNVESYEGLSHGAVTPSRQRKINQFFLFPCETFDPRCGRPGGALPLNEKGLVADAVIVLPPAIRTMSSQGKVELKQWLFRFEPGSAPRETVLAPVEVKEISIAAAPLRELVASEKQPVWLRVFALNWLTETQLKQSTDLLVKLAGDDALPETLRYAAIANVKSGKVKEAGPILASLLQGKPSNAHLVIEIIEAVGAIGDPALAPAVRSILSHNIESSNELVASAAWAAGMLKDPESALILLPRLAAMKLTKPTSFVELLAFEEARIHMEAVATAIARIGTPEAVSGLWRLTRDRGKACETRLAALNGLTEARSISSGDVPTLVAILADEADGCGVRTGVLQPLKNISSPEALAAIQSAAQSKDKDLRLSAEKLLK